LGLAKKQFEFTLPYKQKNGRKITGLFGV